MVKRLKHYMVGFLLGVLLLNPTEVKAEDAQDLVDYINVTASIEVESTIIPYYEIKEEGNDKLKMVSVIYSKDTWINDVIELALTKQGCPYSQARREAKDTYDCSSFVRRMYEEITGVYIGSTTYDISDNLRPYQVSFDELQPGDLVHLTGHIGMVFEDENGDLKLIHATGSGDVVKVENVWGRIKWTSAFRPIWYIKHLIGEEY